MRKAGKLLTLSLAFLLGLTGCLDNENRNFFRVRKFRGHTATALQSDDFRKIHLGFFYDLDLEKGVTGYDHDKDGVFEEIIVKNLPEDHPLRIYANTDSLRIAYEQVRKQSFVESGLF